MKHFLFLIAITSTLCACKNSNLVLESDGTPKATIITLTSPDSLTAIAASELQSYIQQMSGAEIPIVNENDGLEGMKIFVGEVPSFADQELQKEEILIQSNGKDLVIKGGDSMSTLYAVYTFLEDVLGCGFYAPDDEFVPQRSEVSIPIDLMHQYLPPITTRTVHSRLFYDNHDFANKRKVTYMAFPGYVPGAGVHTFHRFVPASKYLEQHPEYYALRNGKRLPTQLCLSNGEVLDIVIEVVDSLFQQYPDNGVLSVSQDDNQQHCQCEACAHVDEREGSPAGSMIEFVNKVAEHFPDKTISTLAYQYTRKAPKTVKPRENVLITLCSIECDRSAPIDEKCVDFAADLVAWGKLTDNIRIWDYTTQFTNFLAPFPNLHTLLSNIQLFRKNNAKWIFEQHSHHPSELFELRSYLTAKLLWNPDANQSATMDDFLEGYYEGAALYVKKYISTVHNELQKDGDFFLFLYGDPSQGFESFLRAELLSQYDAWYDQAEAAVEQDQAVLERVRRARLSVDYAILELARLNDPETFSLTVTNESGEVKVSEDMKARFERFLETCRQADITYMNEMRFTVEEYAANYKHTIAKASQKNVANGAQVQLLTNPKKYANEDPQVLTDGAFGGANFYANWLGFEGNHMEAIIELGSEKEITNLSADFLQVVNHVVFFPSEVAYYRSFDGEVWLLLGKASNQRPLTRSSKINDIQSFKIEVPPSDARYIKVVARNMNTAPEWHHAAGLPSWIFVDEVVVN